MRFSTPEQVKAWAADAALDTYARHVKYGHDLNIFCTPGARAMWQRGFDNAPLHSFESQDVRDYDTIFQRGRAMAELLERIKNEGQG